MVQMRSYLVSAFPIFSNMPCVSSCRPGPSITVDERANQANVKSTVSLRYKYPTAIINRSASIAALGRSFVISTYIFAGKAIAGQERNKFQVATKFACAPSKEHAVGYTVRGEPEYVRCDHIPLRAYAHTCTYIYA